MNQLTVALAQIPITVTDKSQNIKTMEETAKNARKKNVELLIFPELALTGYVCRDLFYQLAEPLSGPTVKLLQRAAEQNGLAIIFGMPTKGNLKGIIYNSSVLIDEGGDIYSYNKIFLPTHSIFDEKRYFRCGQEISCFEIGKFKIGLTICYDIYFPEIYRILALEGADIVACISASPSTRQDYFEVLTKARAIENGIFHIFVNRIGTEDGLQFWGGSRIVSPNGDLLVKGKYYDEDLVVSTIDLDDSEKVRPFIPTIRDLRPEIVDLLRERSHKV